MVTNSPAATARSTGPRALTGLPDGETNSLLTASIVRAGDEPAAVSTGWLLGRCAGPTEGTLPRIAQLDGRNELLNEACQLASVAAEMAPMERI